MVLLDNGVFMSDISILEFLKKSKFNLKKKSFRKKAYFKAGLSQPPSCTPKKYWENLNKLYKTFFLGPKSKKAL